MPMSVYPAMGAASAAAPGTGGAAAASSGGGVTAPDEGAGAGFAPPHATRNRHEAASRRRFIGKGDMVPPSVERRREADGEARALEVVVDVGVIRGNRVVPDGRGHAEPPAVAHPPLLAETDVEHEPRIGVLP